MSCQGCRRESAGVLSGVGGSIGKSHEQRQEAGGTPLDPSGSRPVPYGRSGRCSARAAGLARREPARRRGDARGRRPRARQRAHPHRDPGRWGFRRTCLHRADHPRRAWPARVHRRRAAHRGDARRRRGRRACPHRGLARPAVEAGERLGYLPGTLYEKIDPYLRPLYDALHDMIDPESIPKLIAAGTIEVAPLAYMRGRSLNDAFIILDEAQNTTAEQMKMFLTRLGFGSKIVVTGDITQVDLPVGARSGLKIVREILVDVDDIHFTELTSKDVVRHRLVSDIVDAYARWDVSNERPNLRAAAPRNGPPQDNRRRNRR